MRVLAILVLSVIGALGVSVPVLGQGGWTDQPPEVIRNKEMPHDTTSYCPTFRQHISVFGEGEYSACIHTGAGISLAFYHSGGQPRTALRLPYYDHYFRLYGVCEQMWGCVYSPEADRLVAYERTAGKIAVIVYDDVRSRINFKAPWTFAFDTSGAMRPFGSRETPKMALSANGQWLAAEIKYQGIALADLKTGMAQQVAVTGNMYGRGVNPVMELAVSDDGRSVVAAGLNNGLKLYDVEEECLRDLDAHAPIGGCRVTDAGVGKMIPSLQAAYNPRFDRGGKLLRLQLDSRTHPSRLVILQRHGGGERIEYLALGDSFTSGEGETDSRYYQPGTNILDNRCRVSSRAYPFLLEIEQTKNIACAGATIMNILDTPLYSLSDSDSLLEEVPGVLPQAQYLERTQPTVATVGIGGNDAGLMAKLAACAMPDTCFWATAEGVRATLQEIGRQFSFLERLYERLLSLAPLTKLFAVSYPMILASSDRCDPVTAALFHPVERVYMREALMYLNRTIEAAARKTGIGFIDISGSYQGHELCSGTAQPAMNGLRFGADIPLLERFPGAKVISGASFHPTPFGHWLAARTILSQHGDLRSAFWCEGGAPRCEQESTPPEFPPGWPAMLSDAPYYQAATIARSPYIEGNQLDVSVPPGWFAPGSDVSVSLHSDVIDLGAYQLDQESTLDQAVQFPSTIPAGRHTLFVRGTSIEGRVIVLYQLVTVAGRTVAATTNREVVAKKGAADQVVSKMR